MNWNKVKVNDLIFYIDPDHPDHGMVGHITGISKTILITDYWETGEEDEGEWELTNQSNWHTDTAGGFRLLGVLDNVKKTSFKQINKKYPEIKL